MRNSVVEYCVSTFGFKNEYVVNCSSGVIHQQGRPFNHGFEIHLEQATLQFEFAALSDRSEQMPLKILMPDGSVTYPGVEDGDPVKGFVAEIQEVRDAVLSGVVSPILSGELARDAIRMCAAQHESVVKKAVVQL